MQRKTATDFYGWSEMRHRTNPRVNEKNGLAFFGFLEAAVLADEIELNDVQ